MKNLRELQVKTRMTLTCLIYFCINYANDFFWQSNCFCCCCIVCRVTWHLFKLIFSLFVFRLWCQTLALNAFSTLSLLHTEKGPVFGRIFRYKHHKPEQNSSKHSQSIIWFVNYKLVLTCNKTTAYLLNYRSKMFPNQYFQSLKQNYKTLNRTLELIPNWGRDIVL